MSDHGDGGDVALACAALLVDELARSGVRDACLSPGSRSTPIALALWRHRAVRVHVHLDERSSGFFALGLAKATGRPVAIACTSGTAVANLLPAVVEARHARVPLVLLTADRPPELRETGANQTIDQVRIFGAFPRAFFEAEVPQARPGAARYWRSLGARAAAVASGRPAGPVHLNLPFREPLVPAGAEVDLGMEAAGRSGGEPWERVVSRPTPPPEEAVEALVSAVRRHERGIVLAGRTDDAAAEGKGVPPLAALADLAGWPLLAEPTSGLRRPPHALTAGQHLLADAAFLDGHAPDVVLQAGAPPTSRAGQASVLRAAELLVVDEEPVLAAPSRSPAALLAADPTALAAAAVARFRGSPDAGRVDAAASVEARAASPWLRAWRRADEAAAASLNALLDAWDEPFEPRVARDLAAWLREGSVLVVASSLPVRDLDSSMAPRQGVRVLANRGASGIDGFVSTVLGVAAAGPPTFALAGDLSFLHDLGALAWSARRGGHAVFVVVDNGGGAVFDLLPQAGLPEHEALFVTPHGTDLGRLATATGARHVRVGRARDLVPALEEAAGGEGIWVVEVPVDRAVSRRRRAEVREAIGAVLAGLANGSPTLRD